MSAMTWRRFSILLVLNVLGIFVLLQFSGRQKVVVLPEERADEAPTATAERHLEGDTPVCSSATRISYLREACHKQGYDKEAINWGRLRRNLIVDDKHKIIYCSIPKCGSKSFKHYLGQMNVPDFWIGWSVKMKFYYNVTGMRSIDDLPEEEKDKALREYFKFMVVRHPFDRLRSAWLHKMAEPGSSHVLKGIEDIADEHLRRMDPSRNATFNFKNEYLQFEHFLQLVHLKSNDGFRNAHWTSYYEHCQPCHIRYDHVLRLETLKVDAEAIYDHLRTLNLSEPIQQITHDNKVRSADATDKLKEIKSVYENVSFSTIQGLLDLYEADFSLFGYKWDRTAGATCSLEDNICC